MQLRQHLIVAVVGAADGLSRAGGDTGPAAFTQRLIDDAHFLFGLILNGVDGAERVADPAARSLFLVDRGDDRFDFDGAGGHHALDASRRGCAL